jgi:hypothetical protein
VPGSFGLVSSRTFADLGRGPWFAMSMFSKVNDRIFRCSALVIILASGCLMVFV